ncbi:hypothetical protein M758_1G197300 [Ceratodon purpureus]|uniref:Uncharacterized protein n=1 Tax=Ceratodon purpureus TaxID=3225 RepID=A0A8T0JA07_CERPU|nr:hypothetical protein KC19_1G223600 [Ceratodon purpureus]KAG0630693.1 hypothetical protein M758_1G197300 [Ceratodon purpureus]
MAVTKVQHVTQAASEGLNAKFSDLCDPHDLSVVRPSRRTISKLTGKSRASSKAMRQLRNQERRVSVSSSAADEDAFLMSFIPLKTEPTLFTVRRSFSVSRMGSQSPALGHLSCSTPRKASHGVTKRLLRLCMGSNAKQYTPLTVY